MKKLIKIVELIILSIITYGYFSIAEAISVSPSVVKFSIAPGESENGSFEIHNGAKSEVFIEVFFQDWILDKDNARKFVKSGTNPRSLNEWMTIEQDSFLIPAEGKQIVRYTIEVPEDAKGGYWGLVCFKSRPLEGAGTGIRIAMQLVSFVGLEVKDTLKKEVKIQEVLAQHSQLSEGGTKTVRLMAKVKNLGNVPLFSPSPTGEYKIMDKNQKVVARGELTGTMILPNEIGDYTSEPFYLDNGEYESIVTIDYGMPKLAGKKVLLSTKTLYDWKVLESVK